MKRTTIVLPPDLKRRAIRRAAQRGMSFSAMVREAVARYTDEEPPPKRDPLFAAAPVFHDGGRRDLVQRHDDELYGKP